MPRDPLRFLIRVLLACLGVGLLLSVFGIDPVAAVGDVWGAVPRIVDLIVGAGEWALPYVLTGAVVVIPVVAIAVLLRVFNTRRSDRG